MAAERTCRSTADTDHVCGGEMRWLAESNEWECTKCGAREEGRRFQRFIEEAKAAIDAAPDRSL